MSNLKEYLTRNKLEKIVNPKWFPNIDESKCEYSDAKVFLQGSCQLFAYALNEKFGYNIVEIKQGISCHYFCTLYRNGTHFLADVRGITSDRAIFFSGLSYITDSACVYIEHSKEELLSELREDGAGFGYCFAKYIIERFPERYDIDKMTIGGIM